MLRGWGARAVLAALIVLFWTTAWASASPRRARSTHRDRQISAVTVRHNGAGSLIAVVFKGQKHRTRFLYARQPIERVAVRDVDNDGNLDILATPERGGTVLLWRNRGHGRFALAATPANGSWLLRRAPRWSRVRDTGDGTQLGDERHEMAMPRAPAVPRSVPVSPFRFVGVTAAPSRCTVTAPGRAPPSVA